MATQKRRLGEILVTSGEITQSQLEQALAEQKTNGKRLGETLISLNFLTERKMLKTLEKQLSIPYMFLSDIEIMPEAVAAVPIFLAERYTLVPLKKDGNRLTIAMNDPTNFYAIDDVRMVSGCDISIVLSEQQDIINAINNFYGVSGRVGGSLNKLKEDSFAPVIRRVEDSSEDAPIIKIVNSVIEQAVRDKASDIHIEPQEDDTRVRFRVDGVLRNAVTLPKNSHSAIISRIKIMAEMDIAEKRLPQDGRINIEQGGRDIDLRISTLPTILGEKVVMRILDKTAASIDINDLAFTAKNMELYSSLFNSSYGIVLVTGPTGSGKSTTLYSTLTNINNPNKNIITVEDPVEYRIEGVNQVAVNNKAGLTFANGLRSILRQDPNIIMVGEIRDVETARISIHAALTGHLVFSTLHTNDAAGAITRLIDMGVEPFLVASALRGVVAQRLVRRICPHCKETYAPEAAERAYMGIALDEEVKLYKGAGCGKCNFTGYAGRMAIHEVLPIIPEMKELILKNAPDTEIFAAGRSYGVTSMKEDGIRKVLDGETTASELLRVAYA